MNSTKKTARVAGFLYLFMVITGIVNAIYVPSKLLVRGNATVTAANILASQSLYNINIVDGLVAVVGFLFVALVLYRLLEEVNKQHAALMVILVLVQIPLGLLVFRSGCLPRFLGIWLIINGFAYVTISFTGMLLPQHLEMVNKIAFPAILGEVAFMLWLLLKGAKVQPLAIPATVEPNLASAPMRQFE